MKHKNAWSFVLEDRWQVGCSSHCQCLQRGCLVSALAAGSQTVWLILPVACVLTMWKKQFWRRDLGGSVCVCVFGQGKRGLMVTKCGYKMWVPCNLLSNFSDLHVHANRMVVKWLLWGWNTPLCNPPRWFLQYHQRFFPFHIIHSTAWDCL